MFVDDGCGYRLLWVLFYLPNYIYIHLEKKDNNSKTSWVLFQSILFVIRYFYLFLSFFFLADVQWNALYFYFSHYLINNESINAWTAISVQASLVIVTLFLGFASHNVTLNFKCTYFFCNCNFTFCKWFYISQFWVYLW